jgi:hypothetical protein
MEEEITRAVAVLIKYGFSAQKLSLEMSGGPTKVTMEFVIFGGLKSDILPPSRDTLEKTIIFEKAWFQKKLNG